MGSESQEETEKELRQAKIHWGPAQKALVYPRQTLRGIPAIISNFPQRLEEWWDSMPSECLWHLDHENVHKIINPFWVPTNSLGKSLSLEHVAILAGTPVTAMCPVCICRVIWHTIFLLSFPSIHNQEPTPTFFVLGKDSKNWGKSSKDLTFLNGWPTSKQLWRGKSLLLNWCHVKSFSGFKMQKPLINMILGATDCNEIPVAVVRVSEADKWRVKSLSA